MPLARDSQVVRVYDTSRCVMLPKFKNVRSSTAAAEQHCIVNAFDTRGDW